MKLAIKALILLLLTSVIMLANEEEKESWGIKGNFKRWGLAGGVSRSHIKSADNQLGVFPIIDHPLFEYQGLQMNCNITDNLVFIPGINYVAKFAFDNSDLSGKYKNLKDRDGGFEAGAGLGYQLGNILFKTGMRADINNNSDGVRYYGGIGMSQVLKEFIFIDYGITYNYYNSSYSDYYFGISAEESVNASVNEYHPDGISSLESEISVVLPLSQSFALLFSTGMEYLDKEAESDILEDRMSSHAGVGFFWMVGE